MNKLWQCAKKRYGKEHETAPPDRKLMYILHWENLLVALRTKKT